MYTFCENTHNAGRVKVFEKELISFFTTEIALREPKTMYGHLEVKMSVEYLSYIGSYLVAVRLLKNILLKGTFVRVRMEKRSRCSYGLDGPEIESR